MIVSIIVAIANNNAIGKNNQLLWHLSKDLKRFKSLTMGHPIIMGRKTFESIGRPLPGRRNIVISNTLAPMENLEIAHSLHEAIDSCKSEKEIFIIGGGQIYAEAYPIANRIYLTKVDVNPEDADTFFPEIDVENWQISFKEEHSGFSFINYERIK